MQQIGKESEFGGRRAIDELDTSQVQQKRWGRCRVKLDIGRANMLTKEELRDQSATRKTLMFDHKRYGTTVDFERTDELAITFHTVYRQLSQHGAVQYTQCKHFEYSQKCAVANAFGHMHLSILSMFLKPSKHSVDWQILKYYILIGYFTKIKKIKNL